MAAKVDIINIARNYLRDFPRFFQVGFTPSGRTYELAKPNIDASSLWVAYVPSSGGASVTVIPSNTLPGHALDGYALDERNGLIRLATLPAADHIMVEGYYYEWLTAADLDFYADMAIHYHIHNLTVPLSHMAPVVVDVIGIYALVQALWGLLTEYSRDIDVITSESVHIIGSQRYRMVESLINQWQDRYNTAASSLNIGLGRLEVFNLRRVSKTTNRLVPEYKEREVGDYGPIERLWPEIDPGVISLEDTSDRLRQDVLVDGDPVPGFLSTGDF